MTVYELIVKLLDIPMQANVLVDDGHEYFTPVDVRFDEESIAGRDIDEMEVMIRLLQVEEVPEIWKSK